MPDFAFSRHRPVGFAELVWEVFFTQRGRGVNLPSHFPWLVQPRQSGLWFASLHESGTLLAGLAVRRLPGAPSMAAIGLVCVRPELRGQGVARQLLSSALIETDRLGLSALTLWTAKPEVYAGHGFELEDTGWFGWVTGWPATSGAGRKAISQMHHWPDNAELAGLRRGLPAYVSYGQRLRDDDGRAEVVLLFDGQGPALAEWRGDDNAVLNLLAATMPPRWRLNALADDTLPAALARARAAVNLTPGRLQMWRATDSVRGRARPALRLLDRI